MQILTQGGGFFAAENGVNSNRLLYIMENLMIKNNWFLRDSLLEYTCEKGVACRVDSVHFFVRTVIETYNSESDEIARLLLFTQ